LRTRHGGLNQSTLVDVKKGGVHGVIIPPLQGLDASFLSIDD
jgi:hypothetical protein